MANPILWGNFLQLANPIGPKVSQNLGLPHDGPSFPVIPPKLQFPWGIFPYLSNIKKQRAKMKIANSHHFESFCPADNQYLS